MRRKGGSYDVEMKVVLSMGRPSVSSSETKVLAFTSRIWDGKNNTRRNHGLEKWSSRHR